MGLAEMLLKEQMQKYTNDEYKKAQRRINNFINYRQNTTVFFMNLSTYDKFTYVMLKTYLYFTDTYSIDDLSLKHILCRCLENAEGKQKDNFTIFNNAEEKLFIPKLDK